MANEPNPSELETLARLRTWLEGIPGARIEIGRRYVATIGRQRFPMVEYRETRDTAPGCRAYEQGEREYVRRMVYSIGPIPSVLAQRKADAIEVPGAVLWSAGYLQPADIRRLDPWQFDFHYRNRLGSVLPHVLFSADPHPGRIDGRPVRIHKVTAPLEFEPGQYRHVRYQRRDTFGRIEGCCATVRIENVPGTVAELERQAGFLSVVEIVPVTAPVEIMLAQSRPYPEPSEATNRPATGF